MAPCEIDTIMDCTGQSQQYCRHSAIKTVVMVFVAMTIFAMLVEINSVKVTRNRDRDAGIVHRP